MASKRLTAVKSKQRTSFLMRPRFNGLSRTHIVYAFLGFLIAHTLSAVYAPIQDCDEVFNYWEPTHYLNHGFGKQTWEFSPVYAIRSWLYTSVHALAILPAMSLTTWLDKSFQFYWLRFVLGSVCAVSETMLYKQFAKTVDKRAAVIFLIVSTSTAGNFHAATAYLPSSFAMYTMSFALAAFIALPSWSNLRDGVKWLALGTVLGWPFVAILCLPFVLEAAVSLALGYADMLTMFCHLWNAACNSLLVLAAEVAFDSFFYKKLTCVPLNILWYNVFSGSDKGPEIYGTEPWHFYIRNLLINFNIWFLLAILCLPVILLYHLIRKRPATQHGTIRACVAISPFYLWLAVLTLQPHKEERFMYPIYPCIAFNAALTLHTLALLFHSTDSSTNSSTLINQLERLAFVATVVTGVALGVLRSANLATGYAAPLTIYRGLYDESPDISGKTNATVCIGKEWYRYPSSYHIPDDMRLEFMYSDFDGLLPGSFAEKVSRSNAFDFFPGTAVIPPGMNDLNIGDPEKIVALSQCDFIIDVQFDMDTESSTEPDFIENSLPLQQPEVLACGTGLADERSLGKMDWKASSSLVRVRCDNFLNTAESGTIGRLLWMPSWRRLPRLFERRWGNYCLLRYLPNNEISEEVKAPVRRPSDIIKSIRINGKRGKGARQVKDEL
ncbi:MAG: mannosyltransferase [Chrysothrix sp. TS-e1954]|nr:MAG: mannosyltransferase [Chrysothrix sp. TS-e1954]